MDGGRQRLRGSREALHTGREKLKRGRARLGDMNLNVPAPGSDRQVQVDENGNRVPPQLPRRVSSRRPRKPQPGRIKKLRLAIIAVGPRRPGVALDGLRDDDGDLPGPAGPDRQGAVRGVAEHQGLRPPRPSAREPAQQHAADPGRVPGHLPVHQERRGRGRGRALLQPRRHRPRRHRPRPGPGPHSRRRDPGCFDDHDAVRQERARGAGIQNRAARSSARPPLPTSSRRSGTRTRSSPST